MRQVPLIACVSVLAAPCFRQSVGLQFVHGVDGFIEVPPAAGLTPPSGITVEAWVTYDDATLQPGLAWPTIVRQNLARAAESYFMRVDAGNTSVRSRKWKVVTSAGLQVSATW